MFPSGKNNLNAKDMFIQRKEYNKQFSQINNNEKTFNLWYTKTKFGKVNHLGKQAILKQDFLTDISEEHRAIDFVVDSYKEMITFIYSAKQSLKTCMTTIIDISKPKKSYIDIEKLYFDYFTKDMNKFIVYLSNKKPKSIREFLTEYSAYCELNNLLPHSLEGFQSSNYSSPLMSGLILEFETINYDSDYEKWNKFITSDFFEDYIKIAASFGFYVDASIPWRIIARPGSIQMQKYMKEYNINDEKEMFNLYFQSTEELSFSLFKEYISSFYNAFVEKNKITKNICISNGIQKNFFDSSYKTVYSPETPCYTREVSSALWHDFYRKVRNTETNPSSDLSSQTSLTND